MIYPDNFEEKIEFTFIRNYLKGYCISKLGQENVDKMYYLTDIQNILLFINQTLEFCDILKHEDFPDIIIHDHRLSLKRINIEETFLLTNELFELYKSLKSFVSINEFLRRKIENTEEYKSPNLYLLTVDKEIDKKIITSIERVLDDNGDIKDSASPELRRIRHDKASASRKVSKILYSILKNAQNEGIINTDVSPSIRDGRLVIPVPPAHKRKISGIIHDESDSGKTVYIEPTQVVEANNEITELENQERKEIVRILKSITSEIRPHIRNILSCYDLLGDIDFIRAKAKFSIYTDSILPTIENKPLLDWNSAIHPILKIHLEKKFPGENKIVPLDITLSAPDKRILIISGPNAGGKSVCLKTVGLLQYMLQCGMPVPVNENSKFGIFRDMFINIGDEQSIENELSTFSSHLINMKAMMKYSNDKSLLLIDEFGGGTEPTIGGALAQAMLRKLNENKIFGVITTHFQNLKQYAQVTKGIINGAMLYDRNEMCPLFQLRIGNPGSSFAIEIARKIGIPKEVIDETSEIVGADYISSDKYLQDIIRDKRYWENKRADIHQKEKRLDETVERYEKELKKLREEKNIIISQAKKDAKNIIEQSNAVIERTIKEIKEAEAERQQTKEARERITQFKDKVEEMGNDEYSKRMERQAEKIRRRQERRAKNKKEGHSPTPSNTSNQVKQQTECVSIKEGDFVKLKGQQTIGKVLKVSGNNDALVVFGSLQMNVKKNNLELTTPPKEEKRAFTFVSRETRDSIRETTLNFNSEIDVRGMRGDEAVQAIKYYVDDAQVASVSRLRILHGTGSGILRQLIREYLSTVPAVVSMHDEHPEFGGAGITIVELA